MMSREQQREILAVGLLALALFTLLALIPVSIVGERAGEWFPSGNAMGVVGGALDALLVAFLGASAFLVPPLLVVAGLRSGEWMGHGRAVRLAILDAGLLVLVPVGTWVISARHDLAGWLGASLGAPLVDLLGWLGSLLLCSVALVSLSVGTLGWNPLRSLVWGLAAGGGLAGRSAKALAAKVRAMAEARAEAARQAA
ncbi:MAG: DNA translocase FtsK 4TM domain-containing protein, partial [Longimicrobiales bacterium]|nr:DNA translocase FtsK 4TM domain-containing protein [Longimicrobiales bacterium]